LVLDAQSHAHFGKCNLYFPLWGTGPGYGAYYTTGGLERLAVVFATVIVVLWLLAGLLRLALPVGLYMDLLTRIRGYFTKKHLTFQKNQ
jgi:hypothetical protein